MLMKITTVNIRCISGGSDVQLEKFVIHIKVLIDRKERNF
jgi:hypothetical protein